MIKYRVYRSDGYDEFLKLSVAIVYAMDNGYSMPEQIIVEDDV